MTAPSLRLWLRVPGSARLRSAIVVLAALASATPTYASAETPAPAWTVASVANSTVAPGGSLMYLIDVKNTGDADTASPAEPACDPHAPPTDPNCVTFTASIPAGLTVVELTPLNAGPEESFGEPRCVGLGVPGPTEVTCATPTVFTSTQNSSPESYRTLALTVSVDGAASGTLTSGFQVSGGGATAPASTVDPTRIDAALPEFGLDAFDGQMSSDAAGDPFTQAGGHPYAASTSIDFSTRSRADPIPFFAPAYPVHATKDVFVDLPPGFIGDPTGNDKCTVPEIAQQSGYPLCPPSSQVGTALVRINGQTSQNVLGPIPVFNVVPPSDVPARFAFNVAGSVVTLDARVRSGSDYGISVDSSDIPEGLAVAGSTVTFWGVPADPSHLRDHACPGERAPWQGGAPCPVNTSLRAFLRNPTSCTPPGAGLATTVHVDSWASPGRLGPDGEPRAGDPNWKSATFISHDPPGYPEPPELQGPPQGPTGCENVPFTPTLHAKPTAPVQANSPSGLTVDLSLPQSNDPSVIGEGDLKKTVVTFPAGVRLSPSSAGGLGACSEAQIGLIGTGFPEPNTIHFNTAEPSCPESSTLGTLQIETPLLEKPLTGSVYLAAPRENPFGSLVALYLVAKGPGVIVKLPGRVDLDPATGQITTTFDDNPQLPFSNLHLELKSGPRAALVMPPTCGTYTTHSQLTSWSGRTVSSGSSFTVSEGPGGGPCPGVPPFTPLFTAGTTNVIAGGFSPFTLQLQRGDSEAGLGALQTLSMPPGLLADVASVTARCTDAQANAAACLAASKIGTVMVGAGPGSNPFYVSGDVYLMGRSSTGAFAGDPFGVAVVVHAAAGPFDLGYTVVKGGIQVRDDGSIVVQSEPFPTILQGIPLQLRDVRVLLDRPGFTFNPTSCNPLSVNATVLSTEGQTAAVASRFQAGECRALAFKPSFKVSTQGSTSKANGASLVVRIASAQGPHPPSATGETNIRKVEVALPSALPSRLTTLQKACTETQFAANPAGCPSASDVGTAVAHTPILSSPLSGPAYLVSHGGQAFPDLVLVLQGEGITLHVTGHTQIKKGVTFSRFETVPDAPISSFELNLPRGRFSALAATAPLCGRMVITRRRVTARVHGRVVHRTRATSRRVARTLVMPTTITGQNGAVLKQSTRIAVTGCTKPKPAARARKTAHRKKQRARARKGTHR